MKTNSKTDFKTNSKTNSGKSKFFDEMQESLKRLKPADMEIIFKRVTKHNRKRLHGCILQMPGAAAAPTFYLEDLYDAYRNGTAAEDLAQSLINFAKQNIHENVPGNIDIEDYESVRKNLGLCVLGIDNNKEYLKDILYEKFEDLALVPMIFTDDEYGQGHVKVRKDFLEMWNMTGEEVLREAKENSPHLLPLTFRQIGEGIENNEPGQGIELFVVSNIYYAGGAAVVFYPRVLECIGMALGRDLFVLPSSVNEMIVVTDAGQDPEELLTIVREVNRTQLPPGDVLTDAVYYYTRKNDRLRKILPVYT